MNASGCVSVNKMKMKKYSERKFGTPLFFMFDHKCRGRFKTNVTIQNWVQMVENFKIHLHLNLLQVHKE